MMIAPQPDAVPRLAPGVRLREDLSRGGWVLLAPERVLNTNATAVEVLRLCDGATPFAAIVDALAEKFGGDRERISRDVSALLHDLAAKQMVRL
jgi:pyrroloquinoline quinone biosynthesis protein D